MPLQTLSNIDRFVGKHFPWFVLLSVTLGVSFPAFFDPLNSIVVALFAFITFANSLSGGFRELGNVLLHPLPVLVTMLMLHVVLPVLTLGLGNLLFPDAPLFTIGLVLEYTIPTGVATLMWVGMCGGNGPLCLSIVLLDTLLSPVIIPLVLRVLVGSVVEMDTLGMIWDMIVMVGFPALIGMSLFQLTRGQVARTVKPALNPFSKILLLIVIIANATGCAPFLRDINGTLVRVMAAVFLLCLFGYLAGYWIGKLMKRDYPTVQTMCLNTGMRNISAGAVLAMQYFPADVMFPVAFTPLFLQITTSLIVKVLMNTPSARAWQATVSKNDPSTITRG